VRDCVSLSVLEPSDDGTQLLEVRTTARGVWVVVDRLDGRAELVAPQPNLGEFLRVPIVERIAQTRAVRVPEPLLQCPDLVGKRNGAGGYRRFVGGW